MCGDCVKSSSMFNRVHVSTRNAFRAMRWDLETRRTWGMMCILMVRGVRTVSVYVVTVSPTHSSLLIFECRSCHSKYRLL